MAGGIGFDGLASGLDTGRIVEQLLEVERRPVRLLQDQLASVRATHGAIGTLAGKLATLRQAAVALATPAAVLGRSATSSAPAVLGVVAGTDAAPGTTTITVGDVARASTARSTVGLPTADTALPSSGGVLRFQVGSDPAVEVPVDGTVTLADLADDVNALGAGVTARVVNVGASDAPSYRLHVTADTTGAAPSITLLQDDTGLAVATTAGTNAVLTLDDLGLTVERDTNTVSDLVAGLTFTVRSAGTAVVTVAEDPGAVAGRVQALVTAYDELRRFVVEAASLERSEDDVRAGPLAADATARGAVERLRRALGAEVPGFGTLAELGVTTARDGTLALDEAALRDALASDPDRVANAVAGAAVAVRDLVDDLTASDGPVTIRTAALDDRARRLDASIAAAERRVELVAASLRLRFQALETLLASLAEQARGLAAILPSSD